MASTWVAAAAVDPVGRSAMKVEEENIAMEMTLEVRAAAPLPLSASPAVRREDELEFSRRLETLIVSANTRLTIGDKIQNLNQDCEPVAMNNPRGIALGSCSGLGQFELTGARGEPGTTDGLA